MTNLSVQEHNGILVVDSRLIAEELGIRHKNFLATIEKYLKQIEPSFGAVAFETREFKTKQGNHSTERLAWLTEDQATFLMTLSRNTEQVRRCKHQLVKAFSKAKQVIKETLPAQAQESERIKLELELAKVKQRYQETGQAIALSTSPAMLAFIRGEAALPPQVIHRERFVDPNTGQEIGSAQGRREGLEARG